MLDIYTNVLYWAWAAIYQVVRIFSKKTSVNILKMCAAQFGEFDINFNEPPANNVLELSFQVPVSSARERIA